MRVVVVGASREPSSQANEGSGSASDEVRATLPQPDPAEGQLRPVEFLGNGLCPDFRRPALREDGGAVEDILRDVEPRHGASRYMTGRPPELRDRDGERRVWYLHAPLPSCDAERLCVVD